MASCAGIVPAGQRRAPKRNLRANVLGKHGAFAAFPRLEIPLRKQLHRLGVTAGLIKQRAKLHG